MSLRNVLIDELRDMYSAENQLVKALPKLAKGAKDSTLKNLFKSHLEETKGQVVRLRTVFEHLGVKPTGQHCNGMQGVVEEGSDALSKDEKGASFDAGIVGAALRTEHYEIAGYTASIAMAKTLKLTAIAALLTQNLNEELAAAKKIAAAATPILKAAAAQPKEAPKSPKTPSELISAAKSAHDESSAVKAGAPPKKKTPTKPAPKSSHKSEGILDTIKHVFD